MEDLFGKKAVIFRMHPILSGAYSDVFEYFYFIWKKIDPNIKLVLINKNYNISSHKRMISFILWAQNKYDIDPSCFLNVVIMREPELPQYDFKTCLVLDNDTTELVDQNLLKSEKYVIYVDHSKNFKFQKFDKLEGRNDIILYNDKKRSLISCGKQYTKKMYFKIFMNYKNFEDNTYLTLVSKESKENLNEILLKIQKHVIGKLLISSFDSVTHDENIKIIYDKQTNHIMNFHQRFTRYLYYETGYMDPSPRLPYECDWYCKDILYISDNGEGTDYFDKFKFVDRTLYPDDEILNEMRF